MDRTTRLLALAAPAALAGLAALAGCSPSPRLAATPVKPGAPGVRRLVVLPIDLTVVKDGGRYDPAETVADSRFALDVARNALLAELTRRGNVVAGELAWSGRLVRPDGSFGAPILEEPAMAALLGGLLSGERLPPDVAVRLHEATGADALVLVSGRGTRLSSDKLAAQIAAGSAIGIGVAAVSVLLVAAVLASKGEGLDGVGKAAGGGGGGAARGIGSALEIGARAALLPLRIAAEAPHLDLLAFFPPGHVHGVHCSPAYGIHDGIAPPPAERPKTGFWHGSRLDLSISWIGVREGREIWSGNAERHANALKASHMEMLFRDLLRHAPAT